MGKKLILRNAHIQDKRYNIIEESELKEEFFCHTNQIQRKQCKKLKN